MTRPTLLTEICQGKDFDVETSAVIERLRDSLAMAALRLLGRSKAREIFPNVKLPEQPRRKRDAAIKQAIWAHYDSLAADRDRKKDRRKSELSQLPVDLRRERAKIGKSNIPAQMAREKFPGDSPKAEKQRHAYERTIRRVLEERKQYEAERRQYEAQFKRILTAPTLLQLSISDI